MKLYNGQFETLLSLNKTRSLFLGVVRPFLLEVFMYSLKTEHSFDSAHFLKGYEGKCSNIHGHRWRVVIEVMNSNVDSSGHTRGMIVDFSTLKEEVRREADALDHCLIIEKDTLRQKTYEALTEEGFKIVEMPFRPTAENLAKYFYDMFVKKGYDVRQATVYETSNNCASYYEV